MWCGSLFVLPVLGGMLMASWCSAQPVVWNGRAADDNWSTDFNWNDGVAPVNDGTADILFAGSVRPRPYVDANWSVNSLGFDGLAGAFTISGLALSVGSGGIVNNSERPQTINTPIDLRSAQAWDAAGARLSLGGAINNNGHALTVSGGLDTAIRSTLSNSGGLIKNGTGTLTLGSGAGDTFANSYAAVTTVNGGTLVLDKAAGTVAIAGDLNLYFGGTVIATRSGQFSASSNVNLGDGTIQFGAITTIRSFTAVDDGYYDAAGATLNLTSTAPYALTVARRLGYITPSIDRHLSVNLVGASGGGIQMPIPSQWGTALWDVGLGAVDRVINVAAGGSFNDLTINGVISGGGGIIKTGPGALALGNWEPWRGGSTYTGGTKVNQGLIIIDTDSSLGAAGSPLNLSGGNLWTAFSFSLTHPITSNNGGIGVIGNATLTAVPAVQGGALSKFGSGTLVLLANAFNDSLTIQEGTVMMAGESTLHFKMLDIVAGSGGGVLDLRENSLVLEGGDLQVITSLIRSGLNERRGIISSARGNPYRLGSMINNNNRPGNAIYQSFRGVGRLDGDEVLIRYTLMGDLNLDGTVSISDFIDLSAHFNTVGGATWQIGDVNYDGSVTIADFIDLASNFGQSLGGISTPISAQDWGMLSSFASSAGVPEPALFGLISAAPLVLIRRRHKISCM
jgi:autotransporter-associated beta strand protein